MFRRKTKRDELEKVGRGSGLTSERAGNKKSEDRNHNSMDAAAASLLQRSSPHHHPHPHPHPVPPHHRMAYPIMHDGLAAALPPVVALLAIAFGAFLAWRVAQVKVRSGGSAAGRDAGREYLLEEEARGEDEVSSFGERRERRKAGEEWSFGDDGQRRRLRFFVVAVAAAGVSLLLGPASPLFSNPCLAPLSPESRRSRADLLAVRRWAPAEQQARRGCRRWWRREMESKKKARKQNCSFMLFCFVLDVSLPVHRRRFSRPFTPFRDLAPTSLSSSR